MQEERRVALYISRYAIFSEIDFAIVGATGKVLLIEQKAGLLAETAGGLTKTYPGKEKNVASQMARLAFTQRDPSTGSEPAPVCLRPGANGQ